MLLAIDSGNTNSVFAIFDDNGHIIGQWRASSKTKKTADELAIWLRQLMQISEIDHTQITSVVIASVVPVAYVSLSDDEPSGFAPPSRRMFQLVTLSAAFQSA